MLVCVCVCSIFRTDDVSDDRVKPRPHQQRCRSNVQRSTLSKQHSTLLPKTAATSNEFIVKYRPFGQVECCFDNVAVLGKTATFDLVERIVRLVAFDNAASTLLPVWTGLNGGYKFLSDWRLRTWLMTDGT